MHMYITNEYRIEVPEIRHAALATEYRLREIGDIGTQCFDASHFNEDYAIEILTRISVRQGFLKILEGKMKPAYLHDIKKVFFEYTYPTPPIKEEL